MSRLVLKLAVSVSAAIALGFLGAPLASATAATATAEPAKSAPSAQVQEQAAPAWSYTIRPSCSGWESPIRTGANYWGGASEGGGTPVECQNSAITDCGFEPIEMVTEDGRMIVVGCNYGAGQLIKLFPGAVNDPALLAAHEFGHNWYGHSFNGCASWASPADVMATTMC
jgi:hypothetical protein